MPSDRRGPSQGDVRPLLIQGAVRCTLQGRALSLAQRLCFVTPTTSCTVLVGTGSSTDDTLGPLRNGSGCRKAPVSQVAVICPLVQHLPDIVGPVRAEPLLTTPSPWQVAGHAARAQ